MTRSPQSVRRTPWSQGAGFIAALLGAVAFVGWWSDIAVLKSIVPGAAPVKPNMAAGLLLCGVALGVLATKSFYASRIAGGLLGLIASILGVLTVTERLSGMNLRVDNWLVDLFGKAGSWLPDQMSLATAFCFVVAGTALLVMALPVCSSGRTALVIGLSGALVVIGALALIGFSVEKILGPHWNYMGMGASGLAGAIGFVLLGTGLLALLEREGSLRWSLNPVTTAGFGVGIVLVAVAASLAFTYSRRMLETATWLTHRQEVVQKVQEVLTGVTNLQSQQRLFVILGDEQFLAGREQIRSGVRNDLKDVRGLTSDNPKQQRRLDQLEPLIAQRIDWEDKVIAARRDQGAAVAAELIGTGKGFKLADETYRLVHEMEDEEYRLLTADRRQAESASTTAFAILPLGVFLSLTILSLGLSFLNAGVTEQRQAEGDLRASERRYRSLFESNPNPMWIYDEETLALLAVNKAASKHYGYSEEEFLGMTLKDIRPPEDVPALMENVARTSGELDDTTEWRHRKKNGDLIEVEITSHQLTWLGHRARLVLINDITARKRAERELRELNVELDSRVRHRTAELESANKELEAFSYSVSHDLRSPLRTIDGFSQAVLEDFGNQLPEEGQRYLQTIRAGAQRMGTLIDDLLTFSRLSRLPLQRQSVDMQQLARETFDELVSEAKGRSIEVSFGELPSVSGDPALLRQVWANLLSNAQKYSRERATPLIKVDCIRDVEGTEPVFFVRDNGTGFDMRYADKLFGVFQRLHRAEEFEGTGVGLAIVQRVIYRHGGRIWAEAEEGKGATFYFTLGGD